MYTFGSFEAHFLLPSNQQLLFDELYILLYKHAERTIAVVT
jgi:hypothetical protein